MSVRAIVCVVAAGLAAGLGLGCGTNIPAPPAGDSVSGVLTYGGSAASSMVRPAARVLLFTEFPPVASPLAMLTIESPDFSKPVPYEVSWVTPMRYKVLAQLVDLNSPDADPTTLPAGGYPDFCTLTADQSYVTIDDKVPLTKIDVALYDLAGQTDPCYTPVTICPAPGKSTLNVSVRCSRIPTSADSLVFALFSKFPSMSPDSTRKVLGQDLVFPATLMDNKLAPGTYAAIYACFDVGSNSGMGMCTSEDAFVLAGSTPITLLANQITNVTVDLDNRTVTVDGIDLPATRGCN